MESAIVEENSTSWFTAILYFVQLQIYSGLIYFCVTDHTFLLNLVSRDENVHKSFSISKPETSSRCLSNRIN